MTEGLPKLRWAAAYGTQEARRTVRVHAPLVIIFHKGEERLRGVEREQELFQEPRHQRMLGDEVLNIHVAQPRKVAPLPVVEEALPRKVHVCHVFRNNRSWKARMA